MQGEAIGLARETGQRVEIAASLAGLAVLEGRRGRETYKIKLAVLERPTRQAPPVPQRR